MARSARYKLLVNAHDAARSLFFDLAADPAELHDLSADPATAAIRAELAARVEDWLPAAGYVPYVDEQAPIVDRPNAVAGADHRAGIAAYFDGRMRRA